MTLPSAEQSPASATTSRIAEEPKELGLGGLALKTF